MEDSKKRTNFHERQRLPQKSDQFFVSDGVDHQKDAQKSLSDGVRQEKKEKSRSSDDVVLRKTIYLLRRTMLAVKKTYKSLRATAYSFESLPFCFGIQRRPLKNARFFLCDDVFLRKSNVLLLHTTLAIPKRTKFSGRRRPPMQNHQFALADDVSHCRHLPNQRNNLHKLLKLYDEKSQDSLVKPSVTQQFCPLQFTAYLEKDSRVDLNL